MNYCKILCFTFELEGFEIPLPPVSQRGSSAIQTHDQYFLCAYLLSVAIKISIMWYLLILSSVLGRRRKQWHIPRHTHLDSSTPKYKVFQLWPENGKVSLIYSCVSDTSAHFTTSNIVGTSPSPYFTKELPDKPLGTIKYVSIRNNRVPQLDFTWNLKDGIFIKVNM